MSTTREILASRDELGRIHYHGRVDWQVKVRGIRIELEALEQAIVELPTVKHCEAGRLQGRYIPIYCPYHFSRS